MKYSDEVRRQFAVAQERSRLNDLPGTIQILTRLVAGNPQSAIFNATLANTLEATGEIAAAIEHFRKAVKLEPKSEQYSLGLFHILWEQGRREEALDETKRYMSLCESAEYGKIIAAINSHWPHEVKTSDSRDPK